MKKIKYENVDEVVYYEKLSNGLEVYMYPDNKAKNFYLTFNVKYGSIDTEFKINDKKTVTTPQGTAHFLEHQLFQESDGTAFQQFANYGSSVNAFTTYDLTCYEVISSTMFKENLELLLDFVQNPVFKSASVNNEKGIIKEEIKMYDNNPFASLNFGAEYNLNVRDGHKYLISGTEEDIKGINYQTLYDAYDAFYHPSNMFLVLAGKFKPLEAMGIIKRNQASKEFYTPEKVTKMRKREPLAVEKEYEEKVMDVNREKLKLSYKISKNIFSEYSKVELKLYLDAILSLKFGPESDFLERLLTENLIRNDIEYMSDIRDNYILISFTVETNYKDEIITLIREEFDNLKITKDELTREKRANISDFIMHFNDIVAVTESIQDDVISNNKIVTSYLPTCKNLNINKINDIASKLDTSIESVYVISKMDE